MGSRFMSRKSYSKIINDENPEWKLEEVGSALYLSQLPDSLKEKIRLFKTRSGAKNLVNIRDQFDAFHRPD